MFSWDLAIGFMGVISLPTVASALLAMLCALISPWLSIIVMGCCTVISYTQACSMLSLITGRSEQQLMRGKMICLCVSLVVTMALCGIIGGTLSVGVIERIIVLFANVASLI